MVGRTFVSNVDALAAQLVDIQQRLASLERQAGIAGPPPVELPPPTPDPKIQIGTFVYAMAPWQIPSAVYTNIATLTPATNLTGRYYRLALEIRAMESIYGKGQTQVQFFRNETVIFDVYVSHEAAYIPLYYKLDTIFEGSGGTADWFMAQMKPYGDARIYTNLTSRFYLEDIGPIA